LSFIDIFDISGIIPDPQTLGAPTSAPAPGTTSPPNGAPVPAIPELALLSWFH